MPEAEFELPPDDLLASILEGVSTIFYSLGRSLICLNSNYQVVHASVGLNRFLGEGATDAVIGRPIEQILGVELFGPNGSMRRALSNGGIREGWGATLQVGEFQPRLVSITGAPVIHLNPEICDPRVAFVVVIRATEDDHDDATAAPTIFSGLIARSPKMHRIFSLIEHLSESDATVLITGESGTGKELIARATHVHSPRSKEPFIAVNCGALPGDLLESELFGHVKGAFTGAVRDRIGRFELAGKGTLFLDEVGDLPLPLQVKLLRVLQERAFERVGESESRTSSARIIAATNKDLRQAVLDEEFREDLYYRLRVVPLHIPPLRERREDIEPLARHLLSRINRRHDRSVRLAPDAMRALLRYNWPGNVRELENALEYAVADSRGQTLHAQDLPLEITGSETIADGIVRTGSTPSVDRDVGEGFTPSRETARVSPTTTSERDRIRAALEAHQWRRTEAAEALGMSRTTLWRKMREYGL